jgi:hypothetical protein
VEKEHRRVLRAPVAIGHGLPHHTHIFLLHIVLSVVALSAPALQKLGDVVEVPPAVSEKDSNENEDQDSLDDQEW